MSRFFVSASLLFIGGLLLLFIIHKMSIGALEERASLSLAEIYVFHGVVSIALCGILVQARERTRFTDHLGYIYLMSVAVKAVLFFLVFNKAIFSSHSFSNQEAITMLLPLFLALLFEVFFVSKLLKKKPKLKNE